MANFIGYTMGLNASHWSFSGKRKMVKCEFTRLEDGSVKISAVSARNLSAMKSVRHCIVSAEEFANREFSYNDDVPETLWAFEKLGLAY